MGSTLRTRLKALVLAGVPRCARAFTTAFCVAKAKGRLSWCAWSAKTQFFSNQFISMIATILRMEQYQPDTCFRKISTANLNLNLPITMVRSTFLEDIVFFVFAFVQSTCKRNVQSLRHNRRLTNYEKHQTVSNARLSTSRLRMRIC